MFYIIICGIKQNFHQYLTSTQMLVVDEAHVYSGIFGTNVHYIIKRLKRICTKNIQFIAASATLDDAKEFCQSCLVKNAN